jgi:Tol biopolymer transport system component
MKNIRTSWRFLVVCTLVLGGLAGSVATNLQIRRADPQILLSWPTGAVNFTLQRLESLGETNWTTVTNVPVVSHSEHVVSQDITGQQQFFRLASLEGGGDPPQLDGIAAPASIAMGSNGVLSFSFADPDSDVASLLIIRSNALGWRTSSVPAQAISLQGTGGQISLPLNPADLAFGTNWLALHLEDAGGNVSTQVTLGVRVTGNAAGGAAPVLSNQALSPTTARVPVGPRDLLRVFASFNYSDANGDIERLRVRMIDPHGQVRGAEYSAAVLGLTGTSGGFDGQILTFRSVDAPGSYAVTFTLIDRNGNMSPPLGGGFFLASAGGQAPMAVNTFYPHIGPPGTTVELSGQGFDATDPSSNRVWLAGAPVEVISAWSSSLLVIVPSNAFSGAFRVESGNRVAYSDSIFTVPGHIFLSPDNPLAPVGSTIQFEAALVAAGSTALEWSVDGIPGGNAMVGTISEIGLYVAPAGVPVGSNVTVSVRQMSNPDVTNQTTVTITVPPARPGRAIILAANGGSVRSADGAARAEIPAGALPGDVEIMVRSLRGTNAPPHPPGLQMIGAAEFGPEGLAFGQPATITLPLMRHMVPGTPLPLLLYNPTNSTFTDEGFTAIVAANGDEATAQVSHFSIWILAALSLDPPATPAVVTNITPATATEGMRVPVLLSGSDLTYDLVLEVLSSGVPSSDILPGPLYAATNQAAVLLDIHTIPDLAQGSARQYTLRLRRGTTEVYTDVNFTVSGLDELVLLPGQNVVSNNPPQRTFSEILIHSNATLSIASGSFQVESTGPVTIDGSLLAEGIDGAHAGPYGAGGAGAGGPTLGGHGGEGRSDDGCDSKANYDCSPINAFGSDGSFVLLTNAVRHGIGGAPGGNTDLGFVGILLDTVHCALGNLRSCWEAVAGVIELVDEINDFEEGWSIGKHGGNGAFSDFSGAPNPGFGSSGAGGGGGGVIELDFITDPDGGGGGGGGGGGRPISIVTAKILEINGRVSTKGGNGGDGNIGQDHTWVPFVGKIYGCSGGGGGAGSGGRLTLMTGSDYVRGPHSTVTSGGGLAGRRTALADHTGRVVKLRRIDDAPNGLLRVTDTFRPRVLGQPNFAAPASFLDVDTKVTATRLVRARIFNETRLRIIHNGTTNDVVGVPEPVPYQYAVPVYRAQAVLQEGFNTLQVPGMNGLLEKTILVLPASDSDGDGLGDPDEIVLGSDPSVQDTDGDGLKDLQEALFGSDPTKSDTDDDGLKDYDEHTLNTSPINPDSDGDASGDGAEALLGSDPNSAPSKPGRIPESLILAASSGETAPGSITVINPDTGAYGLLHQPNGGLGFGVELDNMPRVYAARLTDLVFHRHYTGSNALTGGFGSGIHVLSLAYNPKNDFFYGGECTALGVQTGQLVRIDPETGAGTRIGASLPGAIHGLAFDTNGVLFAVLGDGVNADRLARIDPADGGLINTLGPLGVTNVGGLTITAAGTAYASLPVSNHLSLILSVNLTSGTATALSALPRTVLDLASPAFGAFSGIITLSADGGEAVGGSGAALTPDGRYVSFTASASNLVTLPAPNPDYSYAPKPFRRDLISADTRPGLLTLAGTFPSDNGYAGPLSDDGRFFLSRSEGYGPVSELTTLPEVGQINPGHAFRHDFISSNSEPVNVNGLGTALSEDRPELYGFSADGRWVLFGTSFGTSMADAVYLHDGQLYLRNMDTGTNLIVTMSSNGVETGDGESRSARMSSDGRFVYFVSFSTNLTSAPEPLSDPDLFVRDTQTGMTSLVTSNYDGSGPAGYFLTYELFNVTTDGRFAVYETQAPSLASVPDNNGQPDVFVYDRVTGMNTLVSTNLNGEAAGTRHFYAGGGIEEGAIPYGISADGRHVVFQSQASDMVSQTDTNENHDVFLRDMQTGEIRLLSLNTNGCAGNAPSFNSVISADGRRVAFWSAATDLTSLTDANGNGLDAFLYDIPSGKLVCLTHDRQNIATATGAGDMPGTLLLNSNGSVVVFSSPATNLVRIMDDNFGEDLFFRRYSP